MKPNHRIALGAFAGLLTALISHAAEPADTGFKVETLAPGTYVLSGYENNILVSAGDDGIVLVDTLTEKVADRLLTTLKSISTKPIRFAIDTHSHGDHSGGNAFFQKLAPVIAHDNVRTRLMAGQEKKVTPAGWPIVTFSDEMTLHLNGEDIRILHVPPAHTDGDSIVFFTKANVVHMGDVFMDKGISFGERSSGGTYRGLIATLEQLLPQIPADAKIVPGHGPVGSRADVARGLEILKGMMEIAERGIREGKSQKQLEDEKVFDQYRNALPWFMSDTNSYVRGYYRELTGKLPGK